MVLDQAMNEQTEEVEVIESARDLPYASMQALVALVEERDELARTVSKLARENIALERICDLARRNGCLI